MHKSFCYYKFSGKQKGSFTKFFVSVLWDKKFRQNRDDPPPLICMKNFEIKNFLKHKIVLQWNVLAQWDKNFSTENRDISPLSSIKIFPLPKNLWNAEWFPGEVFSVLWDKRNFRQNLEASPSFAWNFSIPEFFRYTEMFSYEFYRQCETKIFQRILVIPPSYAQIFAIYEFFWNTELFPNEIFWYCVTNVFDGETWNPLPLWCIKIFDIQNFLKHWRDAHEIFRYCETK